MALTLNGIALGYVADRVAGLLASEGLTRALIETGEMVALPGGDWPATLPDRKIALRGRAVATSSPLGMTFGGRGRTSHILSPVTLRPTLASWRQVTVSAPSTAPADVLSTAACLTEIKAEATWLCETSAGASLESAIPA